MTNFLIWELRDDEVGKRTKKLMIGVLLCWPLSILLGICGIFPAAFTDDKCEALFVPDPTYKSLGKWHDGPKDLALAFVCQSDNKGNNGTCGEKFKPFNGNCYRLMCKWKPYDAAVLSCKTLNAQLVRIHSKAENKFVQEMVGAMAVWIGLTEKEKSEDWFWNDGVSAKIRFQNWDRQKDQQGRFVINQPDNNTDASRKGGFVDETAAYMNSWWDMFGIAGPTEQQKKVAPETGGAVYLAAGMFFLFCALAPPLAFWMVFRCITTRDARGILSFGSWHGWAARWVVIVIMFMSGNIAWIIHGGPPGIPEGMWTAGQVGCLISWSLQICLACGLMKQSRALVKQLAMCQGQEPVPEVETTATHGVIDNTTQGAHWTDTEQKAAATKAAEAAAAEKPVEAAVIEEPVKEPVKEPEAAAKNEEPAFVEPAAPAAETKAEEKKVEVAPAPQKALDVVVEATEEAVPKTPMCCV